MRSIRFLVVLLLLVLAAAACAANKPTGIPSSTSSSSGIPSSPATPSATVQMTDQLKFVPETVTISTGQTVIWRNTGGIPHTVTACGPSSGCAKQTTIESGLDSGTVSGGASFQHAFATAGIFYYFCKIHGAKTMFGEVIIR